MSKLRTREESIEFWAAEEQTTGTPYEILNNDFKNIFDTNLIPGYSPVQYDTYKFVLQYAAKQFKKYEEELNKFKKCLNFFELDKDSCWRKEFEKSVDFQKKVCEQLIKRNERIAELVKENEELRTVVKNSNKNFDFVYGEFNYLSKKSKEEREEISKLKEEIKNLKEDYYKLTECNDMNFKEKISMIYEVESLLESVTGNEIKISDRGHLFAGQCIHVVKNAKKLIDELKKNNKPE